jgi:hypothetical protein
MVTDDKNGGFQTSPMFLLEKLNQIYVDGERTRKFESETKKLFPTNNLPYSNNLNRPMKNSILRGLFAASLILVSSNAFAQNAAAPATLVASAEILQQIELAQVSPLNFGTLAAGKIKTVNTQSEVTLDGGTPDGETAGVFSVTKAPGFSVTLTLSGLINLPKEVGSGEIITEYQADLVGENANTTE